MFFINPPFGNYLNLPKTISIKGSYTLEARPGLLPQTIKTLRYSSEHGGWINKIGLRNKGIDWALANIDNSHIMSVAILKEDEIPKLLDRIPKNKNIELNISCPNTENGQTICDDPATLNSLLTAVKKTVSKPISIKVSPDVSNETLGAIGEICTTYDTLLINAGNTQYKTPDEVGVKQINFAVDGGGLSGPAIFQRTLEMVSLFAQFNIPIIATGGISTIKHVQALKAAGASLFGMATALVLDPYCIPRIHSRL